MMKLYRIEKFRPQKIGKFIPLKNKILATPPASVSFYVAFSYKLVIVISELNIVQLSINNSDARLKNHFTQVKPK